MSLKKSTGFKREYVSPHLFREDIEAIEGIFRDLGTKSGTYSISFLDQEFSSIKEIPPDTNPVKEFEIGSYFGINLILLKYYCSLKSVRDDVEVIAACAEIDQIVAARDRTTFPIIQTISGWLFYICAAPLTLASSLPKDSSAWEWKLMLISIVCTVVFALIWTIPYPPRIDFEYKTKKRNFLARNKDQIVLAIGSAFVGAVLTVAATRLIG